MGAIRYVCSVYVIKDIGVIEKDIGVILQNKSINLT